MMQLRLASLLLAATVCMTACASRSTPSTAGSRAAVGDSPLRDTAWVLTEIDGQPPLAHVPVHLHFAADGALSGSDGCNVLRGAYEAGAATLQVADQLASTMMACTTPINAQAKRFAELLLETRRFAVNGGYLVLSDGSDRPLLTMLAKRSSLPGSTWRVSAYNNGKEAVVSVTEGSELTLAFGDNGRVTGSAGCNGYVADFDTEANKVAIGMPRTTRKACAEPAGVMEQEALFLKALQGAATFRINGDRLELRTTDSALAVVLQRQEVEKAP